MAKRFSSTAEAEAHLNKAYSRTEANMRLERIEEKLFETIDEEVAVLQNKVKDLVE